MPTIPSLFHQQMADILGASQAQALAEALATSPVVSIRQNPFKQTAADLYPDMQPVPWCATGAYLAERPSFTTNPLLHAGAFYVQEAASMFIEQAYRAMDIVPQRVLDLCAAPGGKSTLWRTLLPDDALLVANEPLRQRAQILAENLTKWGHPGVIVTNAYGADFAPLEGCFDIVATDVPCSGEGMFRKDEGAVSQWSPGLVEQCAQVGWDIVSDVWPALRTGGYLVYSTCTFNREEDEHQVARICRELGAELVAIPTLEAWGIEGDTTGAQQAVYHFFPHRAKGEGFFLALLRKTADTPSASPRKGKRDRQGSGPVAKGAKAVSAWLSESSRYKIFATGPDSLSAIREVHYETMLRLAAHVRMLQAGITLAVQKGHKLIPEHALALSTACAPDAFPRQELDLDTALSYLRRETIVLPGEAPRGYTIVTFQGLPLGFVNNLGNRANNLYPNEWRIRTR